MNPLLATLFPCLPPLHSPPPSPSAFISSGCRRIPLLNPLLAQPDLRQGLRQTHFSVPNRKFRFRIIYVFIYFRHATENFSVRTETWFATRSTPNPLSVPAPRLAIKILKGHNRKTEITLSVHLVANQGLEGTDIRPAASRPTLPHIETLYRGPVAKRGTLYRGPEATRDVAEFAELS